MAILWSLLVLRLRSVIVVYRIVRLLWQWDLSSAMEDAIYVETISFCYHPLLLFFVFLLSFPRRRIAIPLGTYCWSTSSTLSTFL